MASTEPRKTQSQTSQPPSEGGDACASCGKPLAADQRYCLNCGTRRADPRVDFEKHLFSGPASASDNGLATTQATSRGWNPLAAAALLGLLGIMLLVGVLIGKDENDEQSATTAPPAQTTPATGATTAPVTPAPTTTPAPTAGGAPSTTPFVPGGAAEQEAGSAPSSSGKGQGK